MLVRDYNAPGRWSAEEVVKRYQDLCCKLDISVAELVPKTHSEGGVKWIYPIMDEVIAGVERGDRACIAIAIEFIEEDQHFSFGRALKSNAARALRRAALSEEQMERVRQRVVGMLLAGSIPREFKEYAKLLKRVGLGSWWPIIEQRVPRDNPFAMRYYNSLVEGRREPPVRKAG